ncbi:MAG: hypothetical protein O3A14_01300 [Cyanobacteria bacterium]|nr:hypothetical protein [Cyanobacteriota bacterium]
MPNDRRPGIAGGTDFITQVTHQRHPWLCSDLARHAPRTAINTVRHNHPFAIKLEDRGRMLSLSQQH